MNPSAQSFDARIDERAAYWAARLEGSALGTEERAELDAWLAESGAHRAALSSYCQFSADLEEQLPALVSAGRIKMPAPRTARRSWRFPGIVSIALAATAMLVLALWIGWPARNVETIATATRQRTTHTLTDGSRVELNAHTSLRFVNGKSERRVHLARGEAIFSVTKDSSRPFFVETPTGTVQVTGTMFNVWSDASLGAFDVVVAEGSVQARPASNNQAPGLAQPFQLTAGKQLSARRGVVRVDTLSATAVEDALSWRHGQVVFNDVPLREAVARFAHYHGRAIQLADGLGEEPIGGNYSLEDLSGFLQGMATALKLELEYRDNGVATLKPATRP